MPNVTTLPNDYGVVLADRIASRSVEDGECWKWTGSLSDKGYALLSVTIGPYRTVATRAHRVAWLAYRGEIPEGLMLDHLCRNRRCVNPWHLDPVTNQVNQDRGSARKGYKRPSTWKKGGNRWNSGTCDNGHDVTDEHNVYYDKTTGGRETRRCIVCAIDKLRSKQRFAA